MNNSIERDLQLAKQILEARDIALRNFDSYVGEIQAEISLLRRVCDERERLIHDLTKVIEAQAAKIKVLEQAKAHFNKHWWVYLGKKLRLLSYGE